MTRRAAILLATLAGFPTAVSAQELFRISYSWLEVQGTTTVPVSTPNSIVDPGEGARISVHFEALINGTNAVGQTTTYSPPPPPGVGTVRGIGSYIYNLRGDNGQATAAGIWGSRLVNPALGGNPSGGGWVLLDGALVDSFGQGQFVAPGGTANSLNPVPNAFCGVWKPASYAARTVNFKAEPGTAAPTQHSGLLLAYSITQPDPNDPTTWYENYYTKYIGADFGSGVSIPIAPSPASAAVLAFASVLGLRRRQRITQESSR